MKNCIKCGQEMATEIKFCPNCGADQKGNVVYVEKTGPPTMLTILVIFTIIGSLFSMGKSLFFDTVESYIGFGGSYTYYIFAATCVGTMVGSILMISRKLNGLYIYTVCQVIFILMFVLGRIPSANVYYATSYTLLVALPAVIFLVLYWSKDVRRYLGQI